MRKCCVCRLNARQGRKLPMSETDLMNTAAVCIHFYAAASAASQRRAAVSAVLNARQITRAMRTRAAQFAPIEFAPA